MNMHSFGIGSPWFTTSSVVMAVLSCLHTHGEQPWVTFQPAPEQDRGLHIVLVSGDEEYRSEEALPEFARILTKRHGFTCTVLFAIDPDNGEINPMVQTIIPGLHQLESADLAIFFTRFRNLPEEQMRNIVEFINSGKPIFGIRTATHAFNLPADHPYYKYSFQYNSEDFNGGFGRQVLGETWVDHHGIHGSESTLGIIAPEAREHPITNGIDDGDIWGPTDVYTVRLPLTGEDTQPLVLGQVLTGMHEDDTPRTDEKNDPMMPIAWTRSYTGENGNTAKVFTSTIGSSQDFASEGLRRLWVNAAYWLLGIDVPENADVGLVTDYDPSPFKMDGHRKGVRPEDLPSIE